MPVRIITPTATALSPMKTFPRCPAESMRCRQRCRAVRDRTATASIGRVVPTPNANMTAATPPRSLRCAASTEAAPSVGPTQGLHTRPSSAPTTNWPAALVRANRRMIRSPAPARPLAATPRRACIDELMRASPSSTKSTADTVRNGSPSRPIAKPIVATKSPVMVNDVATPPRQPVCAGALRRCRGTNDKRKERKDAGREGRQDAGQQPRAYARDRHDSACGSFEQPLDHRRVGRPGHAPGFLGAVIDDQGALHLHTQLAQKRLAGIEIDVEHLEVREFRRSVELLENRSLSGASRAPGCLNEDQDRFAALLRRVECSLLVGQDGRGVRRAERSDTHAQGKARNDSESFHGLTPPGSVWRGHATSSPVPQRNVLLARRAASSSTPSTVVDGAKRERRLGLGSKVSLCDCANERERRRRAIGLALLEIAGLAHLVGHMREAEHSLLSCFRKGIEGGC